MATRPTSGGRRKGGAAPDGPSDVGYRDRILAAGSAEFTAKGFSGARVDEIARVAGCNKQLIYYYFADKAGLYEECLKRMFSNTHECRGETWLGEGDLLSLLRSNVALDSGPEGDWGRLWLWESIERACVDITLKRERRSAWRRFSRQVRAAQDRGEVEPSLDTELLALAILSISAFPALFPQLAELITGSSSAVPAFRRRQEKFLRDLVATLAVRGEGGAPDLS